MDKQKLTLVGSAGVGAGLGAGLMYLLDPQGGKSRRSAVKDKTAKALSKGGQAVKKTSLDLGQRTKGLVAAAGSRLRRNGEEVEELVVESPPALADGNGKLSRLRGYLVPATVALGTLGAGLVAAGVHRSRGAKDLIDALTS